MFLAEAFYHCTPRVRVPGRLFLCSEQKTRDCNPKPEKPDFCYSPFQISFRSAFSETSVYERPWLLEIDFRVVVAAFEELFHFLDAWLAWVGARAGICNCVHSNVVKA